MKEFQGIVAAAIQKLDESGKIQEMIEKAIEKAVADVISSTTRQYSEFGRSLEKAVGDALKIDAGDLGLPGYNQIVLAIVRKKLETAIETAGTKQLEVDMERLLAGPVPAEIKLSELVDQFKEWVKDEDSSRLGHNVTALVKRSSYGYFHISLDPNSDTSDYNCQFRIFSTEKGEVFRAMISGKDAEKTIFLGGLGGFEKTLFMMYARKTKVIVDTDDPDTYISDESDV